LEVLIIVDNYLYTVIAAIGGVNIKN